MINPPGKIDDVYLNWVRLQGCEMASLLDRCPNKSCQAHHVTGRGMGGSKRDDRDAVPLCSMHHKRIHDQGMEKTFSQQMIAAHRLLKRYLDRVVIPSMGEPGVDEEIF